MDASALLAIIPIAGIAAVVFALYLARDVLSRDVGPIEMQDVAGTIYEGAVAFIRRQYTTIGILALVGAVVIGIVIALVENEKGIGGVAIKGQDNWEIFRRLTRWAAHLTHPAGSGY